MEIGIDAGILEMGEVGSPNKAQAKHLTSESLGHDGSVFGAIFASYICVCPSDGVEDAQPVPQGIPDIHGLNGASVADQPWVNLPRRPFAQKAGETLLNPKILEKAFETMGLGAHEAPEGVRDLNPFWEESLSTKAPLAHDGLVGHLEDNGSYDLGPEASGNGPFEETRLLPGHIDCDGVEATKLKVSEPLPPLTIERLPDREEMGSPLPEAYAKVEGRTETRASAKIKTHSVDLQSGLRPVQGSEDEKPSANLERLPVYLLRVQTGQEIKGGVFKTFIKHPTEAAEILAKAAKQDLPNSVEFKLDPPGLGRIRVVIASKGEEVCVKFFASTPGSHQALIGSEDVLAQALSEKGLSLAGFFVDHGMQGRNRPRQESKSPERPRNEPKVHGYDGIQQGIACEETVMTRGILDYRI